MKDIKIEDILAVFPSDALWPAASFCMAFIKNNKIGYIDGINPILISEYKIEKTFHKVAPNKWINLELFKKLPDNIKKYMYRYGITKEQFIIGLLDDFYLFVEKKFIKKIFNELNTSDKIKIIEAIYEECLNPVNDEKWKRETLQYVKKLTNKLKTNERLILKLKGVEI